jgi:hypothetical protein
MSNNRQQMGKHQVAESTALVGWQNGDVDDVEVPSPSPMTRPIATVSFVAWYTTWQAAQLPGRAASAWAGVFGVRPDSARNRK